MHRNLACVIDKSSRGAKLERAFEELPQKEENAENEAVRRFATMNVAINEIGGMIGGLVKAERRRLNELRKRKAEGKDV